MCGRFVSSSTADEIAHHFDARSVPEAALPPSWNVAPTADVAVVLEGPDGRIVALHHWGLVPIWAESPKVGARMINARAEGLDAKPAFKHAFRRRRCIVPADGFYEWRTIPGQKVKQPYFVTRADGEMLAFAGLWEEWRGPARDGAERLRSTTIITTAANETMAPVHDRMPVILPEGAWDRWLDPGETDVHALGGLLVPAPPDLLQLRPVGRAVGNVRNQGPHLIDEVVLDPALETGRPGAASAGA
jgi:putative SOS response-associated peptidase YedK